MKLRSIAILRALEPRAAARLAERCWAAGIDLVEVPVQGERGWASLAAVADVADGRAFGAGTVLTPGDARRAVELGASVVISPGIDHDVVQAAAEAGALPLPGVMTPTDVAVAARLDLSVCKLFPATVVGQGWVKALHGPFPDMAFIAVGGVDARNAVEYLESGASGVAFGSSIEQVLGQEDPAAFIARLHRCAGGSAASSPVGAERA